MKPICNSEWSIWRPDWPMKRKTFSKYDKRWMRRAKRRFLKKDEKVC